jgi:radical SAM family uncharacterized protein/radical SAM-linked protein
MNWLWVSIVKQCQFHPKNLNSTLYLRYIRRIMMEPALFKSLLQGVEKPAQYLGNEVNAIHKKFSEQNVRVCLIFPDAYEMGMSHMGQKILYEILNRIDGVVAERCFAPGLDLEKNLREQNVPLFSLESQTPLHEFDVIGFSVPYELTYTNMLNIIDLGGVPVWQKDRKEHHPLIVAGGTSVYNPEPYADFVDAIAIGDGEELIVELVDKVWGWKKKNEIDLISKNQNVGSRSELLHELKDITGCYIPSFFEPVYNEDGTLKAIKPLVEGYESVEKRIVKNLDEQVYPTNLVLPNVKLIHDRIGIEIQRGCTRMCRFCQAGYIERPTRQRSPEKVLEIADESYKKTGIEEISLLSLSAGDYQTIVPTLKEMNARYANEKVSISVPATRTETLTPELIEQVKKVRKTGFTIAPEGGSERMRRVINKGNKVEDLMRACRNAFSAGYELIKFYYLCGLPFETDEDLVGMASEAREALQIGREYTRRTRINVSVSSFVPKPFTPFQWTSQMTIDETKRKHHLVKSKLGDKALQFKCHEPEMSFLEGLFSRGDRRLSEVLYKAYQKGCRFDEWREHFRFDKWQEVFEETGVDLYFYIHRERDQHEVLPWDHLFSQMRKEWLWKEFEAARNEAYVADCSIEKCAQFCGVCDFKEVKNKIYVVDDNEVAAKKGNRDWIGRFGKNTDVVPHVMTKEVSEVSPTESPLRYKIRALYEKMGMASYFGHLELMNHMKRAIQRTGVKVAYSEGFHPQIKLAMGHALPMGLESEAEYFDLILLERPDLPVFLKELNLALPDGLRIVSMSEVERKTESLNASTEAIDYVLDLSEMTDVEKETLSQNVKALPNEGSLKVERIKYKKGKRTAKEFILNEHVLWLSDHFEKEAHFRLRSELEGSVKLTEVLERLIGVSKDRVNEFSIKKTKTHFHGDLSDGDGFHRKLAS